MTERPILFSGPMVRALLDGRKTQTRRIVKLDVPADADEVFFWSAEGLRAAGVANVAEAGLWARKHGRNGYLRYMGKCPYGVPGHVLWGRETHLIYDTHGQHRNDDLRWGPWGGLPTRVNNDGTKIAYFREGFDRCDPGRWRPSIHMPRWASRLTLDITSVHAERLQDISAADAFAEGGQPVHMQPGGPTGDPSAGWLDYREGYRSLWGDINGPDSWAENPWVWVVSFEVRQ